MGATLPKMDFRMLPLTYRFEDADRALRPPGFDSQWRAFGNTLISQVRGGSYRVATTEAVVDLEPGQAFLVPPGLRHRVAVVGRRAVTTVFTHLQCRVYELRGLFTVLSRPIIFTKAQGRRIGACTDALIVCRSKGVGVATSVAASALLADLVGIAVAACPDLEARWDQPERERLLPLLRYVQDHLADPITRRDLARVLGVSVPHLHTLCLRAFGVAPMDLVRTERMQHARQLLHWSPIAIAEVGRRCGFEDPYYFSRAFSRAEGTSPSRYRSLRQAAEAAGA